MEVFLQRHAESTANATHVHDIRNVRLSPGGEKQAQKAFGYFDLVFCSPLRRARQTLEQSKIRYGRLVITPEAREKIVHPSDLLTDDEMEDGRKETDLEVQQRCVALFERLAEAYEPNKSVLIISHCLFLMEFTQRFAGKRLFLRNAERLKVTLRK